MTEGIIYQPKLRESKHTCSPPQDQRGIVDYEPGTVWLCRCGIIYQPKLRESKHTCSPPQDQRGIVDYEPGTVWLCRCGKTWVVYESAAGFHDGEGFHSMRWAEETPRDRHKRERKHGPHTLPNVAHSL